MGEYVRYKGEETKIGTCECLYYASFPKYIAALEGGFLGREQGSANPIEYAKPDSGFLFRFPFPDEDKLPIGPGECNYNRGVAVNIDATKINVDFLPDNIPKNQIIHQIEIVQQKLVHRQSDKKLCLAVVWRDPSTRESYRIEDDDSMKKLIGQIIKHHIQNETNSEQKAFYRKIALRILKGYRLNINQNVLQRNAVQKPRQIAPKNNLTIKYRR